MFENRTDRCGTSRVLGGIFGLIALLLIIAACGDAQTATPTIKQEIRVNLQAEPSSLDPQQAALATDISVIRQVFDGLLVYCFSNRLTINGALA